MSQRIAVVAGGGGGLGRSVVVALHSRDVTVVAVDRDEGALRRLPEAVHREVADATDPNVAGPLLERIAAQIGPPDVLVNTIGAYELGESLSVTPQSLRKLMDVNLGTALWLTQAVVPHMRDKGAGVIVHTAARQGVDPVAGTAAYGVTKAALIHLVRTLDLELRPLGIRVNVVLPQLIATEKNKSLVPPDALAGAVEPEAIAEVIAFLAGDGSAPVSGAAIPAYG
ncbi:MAG TPA: SDR family oxidoreductase [Acidimicrobiales bacterium]|jgi:NAD(P)-dependent dehydrogenase (short-subunit alcohol dehydrogenase family)|nr:SDR family oxidoreductase [Acidimicrobiales bacterium]